MLKEMFEQPAALACHQVRWSRTVAPSSVASSSLLGNSMSFSASVSSGVGRRTMPAALARWPSSSWRACDR